MSEPLVGEIRLFPYGWAPEGWLPCDGRQVPIRQFQVLAAVISNTYGGDLQTYLNLPDLRARVAVGYGNDPVDIFDPAIASAGGAESVTLTLTQVPAHTHNLVAAPIATPRQEVATASGNWIAQQLLIKQPKGNESANAFAPADTQPNATLNPATLTPYQGQNGPHENRQPYLVLGYYIAVQGEFPMRQ